MYQKFSLPENSQNFQNLAFFGKIDRSLEKNLLKLSKSLNFASFFFQIRLDLNCWSCVLKTFKILGFLGKEMFFFSKEYLKVFKSTKHGYFPSECFPKVIIAHAISKSSQLEFFLKRKWRFCENILERLQEHYLAFFNDIACQIFLLLRNSQNIQSFGLFREIDVVFEKILIFL